VNEVLVEHSSWGNFSLEEVLNPGNSLRSVPVLVAFNIPFVILLLSVSGVGPCDVSEVSEGLLAVEPVLLKGNVDILVEFVKSSLVTWESWELSWAVA
jgi:hypothetical protein